MSRRGVFYGFVLAAAACLVMTAAVLAQQTQQPQRPTPESRVADMDKAVTLTADQKTQIVKIYTDAAANAQGGGRGGGFGFGATNDAVEKVLTPDQVKKWRAYTLKQSVDRAITRIDEAVTLTAEQKTKIVPIIEKQNIAQNEFMAKARAAGGEFDQEAWRAKMTELRDATSKALESILTKEQLEKYKAIPQRGGGRAR